MMWRKNASCDAVSRGAEPRNSATRGEKNAQPEPPKLARRSANRNSTMKSGRTIAERREKLETASERTAARNKVKRRERRRIISTLVVFVAIAAAAVFAICFLTRHGDEIITSSTETTVIVPYAPTIEVIDEDTGAGSAEITARMKEYIGQAEADFRELGYNPEKAVIPAGAVREVDFYLENQPGFIKMLIDRGTGVSVEDADRVIRYLKNQGVDSFQYIDVRIEGKAYYK